MRIQLLIALVSTTLFSATSPSPRALYNGLDPYSIPQQLAFYELYPNSPEGEAARQRALTLLSGGKQTQGSAAWIPEISTNTLIPIIDALAKQRLDHGALLEEKAIIAIDSLASRLPHKKLKGHSCTTEEEVLALSPEEVDLARALLLSCSADAHELASYEATLDLMALQIAARLPSHAVPEAKISAINDYLFRETGVRFPPHALFAKEIDHYTFLPSVLDSRRGVCLGVSSLYLCLAQRLELSLEVITPPGHIFVRYRDGDKIINIETTMRGVNIPTREYLGVQTRSLQLRNIKEVVGLSFMNQAAVEWQHGRHEKAVEAYEHARLYLPEDELLKEFLGYNLMALGREEEGRVLLEEVRDWVPDYAITKGTMAEDLLEGQIDAAGLCACFQHIDERRDSILEKQEQLREVLKNYPRFRGGWFQYAAGWLQLNRTSEAMQALLRAYELGGADETTEYYLAALSMERYNYPDAWQHLRKAQELVSARSHDPKALRELQRELRKRAPE